MKKIFWKMYQDKESTQYNFALMTTDGMNEEVLLYFEDQDEDAYPPVFEPIKMTQKEFDSYETFDGF